MLSLPFLVVLSVILLVIYVINENKKKPDNFPPGPPILPIWGSYWFILKEHFKYPHKAFVKLHAKYKTDVLGFYMGKVPTITCYKYDLCKELQTREEFIGRIDAPTIRVRGRGNLNGIFFADGDYWKDQRWFSLRNMRDYGFGRRDADMEDTTADEVRHLLEFLQSKPKQSDDDVCAERGVVLMPDVVYGATLNAISHTLSSTHFDDYRELRDVGRATIKLLNSIDSTGNSINVTPWLRHIAPNYFGWNSSIEDQEIMLRWSKKIVREHQKTYIDGHLRDFIDVYIKEMNFLKEQKITNTSFTDLQLINTIVDYIFPPPSAIGSTMAFLFAELIYHPSIQVKIQEEIDRVVGRSRLPVLDDRKNMHYLEATLREVIRKDTLVPLSIVRRCVKDTTFGGYFVPKDTMVLPNLWAMHNDPEFWGDPENFRPERFLDENGMLMKKDYTLGFGAGKRLCAGETFARQTMFLLVSGILQNFNLHLAPGKPKPDLENLINGINTTMVPYWMKFVPRS